MTRAQVALGGHRLERLGPKFIRIRLRKTSYQQESLCGSDRQIGAEIKPVGIQKNGRADGSY